MVTLKLNIEDSFYKQEEREGFIVSPEMKRIWAVELDLLNEFARVCVEHNLKWFAHAGTMLGAIRHHGFIPWDDDIDVTMPRKDYEKLCSVAPQVFSSPYFFQNDDTDPFFGRSYSRLRNSNTTAIQVFEKDFAFPFNQGIFIDIFPYDNVSDNDEELKSEIQMIEFLDSCSWRYRHMVHFYRPQVGVGWKPRMRYFLRHLLYKYINKSGGDYRRYQKDQLALTTKHNEEHTRRVGEMIISPLGRNIWDRSWVDDTIWVPFEMIRIPVPKNAEACLCVSFGSDWRIPKRQNNYHGQIVFDVDRPYTEYLKR